MYKELKDEYKENISDVMEFEQRKHLQQNYLRECQKIYWMQGILAVCWKILLLRALHME